MKRIVSRFMKAAVPLIAVLFAGISATAYCAGGSPPDAGFQTAAAAAPVESNPPADQTFYFTIRRPQADWQPLTGSEKFRYYLRHTYGPESTLFILAGSGINQARDAVPEWGQGMEGYGKRLASAYGRRAVRNSIQHGLGALLHEDPRYFSSGQTGIWGRSLYAAGRVFVAQKDDGGIRPAYSRFIGAFGASYISRQWHPESYHTPEDYIASGAATIGFDMVRNVLYEFWPDIKKKLRF
ncbi:MAG: hypothetical protein H6Q07_224 [Acidobacteria bacterium]|nr:hypothetical protein [Acidobacteriota bacterium]